jgi:kojibiose phosphorylase
MPEGLQRYLSGSEWHVAEQGWDPARQNVRESLFTLGNGFLGSRGVLEEIPQGARPGTFFAGLYDTTGAQVTELVNAPNPIFMQVAIGGEKLGVAAMDVLDHKRLLDMQRAALFRETLFRTTRHRSRVRYQSLRFFSMHNPHVAVMLVSLTPLDETTTFTIRASVDTGVTNMGLVTEGAKRHFHIADYHTEGPISYLCTKTLENEVLMGYAHQTKVKVAGREKSVTRRRFEVHVRKGSTALITKYFTFFTSQRAPTRSVHTQAVRTLKRAVQSGFEALYERHTRKWQTLWRRSDVRIKGDRDIERAIRFNIYHMHSAGSEHSSDEVSVGARLLSGEGYRGHVFWDTEIFLLPFFFYTAPEVGRDFLIYRHRRLKAAKENAKARGYEGAMFPWESAALGDDVTPTWAKNFDGKVIEIHTMQQEHHITADIAFAACHYYEITGDVEFMCSYGLELLIESARFWASRVEFDAKRKRYAINGVIGPDEFHEKVNNNAFTNTMARWNLKAARSYYQQIRKRCPDETRNLTRRLRFKRRELDRWQNIHDGIALSYDKSGKIIEQFDGFFRRRKLPLPALNGNLLPDFPSTLALDKIGGTQFVKQADVVMLLYLAPDGLSPAIMKKNFTHYERRTLHKSSLSASVHAFVAGRLGLTDQAYRYLQISALSDLRDVYGNTAEGMHAAALGGTWQSVVGGLVGAHVEGGVLSFTPHLPAKWRSLGFALVWRGLVLDVVVENRAVSVHCQAPARKSSSRTKAVTIEVDGEKKQVRCGEKVRFSRVADRKRKIEGRGLFGGEP